MSDVPQATTTAPETDPVTTSEEAKAKLSEILSSVDPDDLRELLGEVFRQQGETGPAVPAAQQSAYTGLRFFRCINICNAPILDKNGNRQFGQQRSNQVPFEMLRTWEKGVIYPFESMEQLPPRMRKVFRRDRKGKIVFEDDPRSRDPLADRVPAYEIIADPDTGKKAPRTEQQGIVHFVEEAIPADRVALFLAGDQGVGIENPVQAADLDGNYQRHLRKMDVRSRRQEDKIRALEGAA